MARTNYNRARSSSPTVLMKVRELSAPVRIRAGAGTDFAHTGKYLGKGIFDIVEIANGEGSLGGWGKLSNGDGWVALDFVEIVDK